MINNTLLKDISNIITLNEYQARYSYDQFIYIRSNTINSLIKNGVNNYPMYERISHLRENILSYKEALKKGFSIYNKHFHNIGVKSFIEIIYLMDNPYKIFQYTKIGKYDNNNYLIVIKYRCYYAIIPIEVNNIDTYGNYFNRIKSLYLVDDINYLYIKEIEGKIKEIIT